MRFGRIFVLLSLIGAICFLAYRVELAFLKAAPALSQTLTPSTQMVTADLGSYDVLGHVVSQTDAAALRQTPEG